MALFRDNLPQANGTVFLTDSGLETDLVFNHGIDLPEFAAFPLVDDESGRRLLRGYFAEHLAIAAEHGVGIALETPTWRASSGWGARLGYDGAALRRVNQAAVDLVTELRANTDVPVVASAAVGPEGDGYRPSHYLAADEARAYHAPQLEVLADTDIDMAHAMTMTYVDEAIGIAEAARAVGLPLAVSFTVETDGALPDGTALGEAIQRVDDATGGGPVYYGINCAHPTHFSNVLDADADWASRFRCLRANASTMSHDELDEAAELDSGNPTELGSQYADLRRRLTNLTVLGGCCGTDARHVRAIADACL
jgi:homocysteine S-methyltransferase